MADPTVLLEGRCGYPCVCDESDEVFSIRARSQSGAISPRISMIKNGKSRMYSDARSSS